mmetsp:Transcript_27812/g.71909  ORF Transcript_27812/g.71909 Transcript_27812/m.71909 type:complete len:372 (+) Transcript_27812:2889-4004(+)
MGPPWANLIMAPSLALPLVFHSISVIVDPSPCTRTLLKGRSTRLPVTSSSKYLSKLHVLHNVLHLTRALKPALSLSNVEIPFVKLEPASWIFGWPFVSYTTWATVMMFWVNVPVLSEQMHDVEPSVSTPSKFLTITFFVYIRFAVSVKQTVTVASNPSGTLATMMPIINTKEVTASWPMPSAAAKKEMPSAKAIAEMIWMKWWISLLIGVCSASVDRANCAIFPMTVSSAIFTTTPTHEPSGTCVPKKQRFAVSNGSALVHSGLRLIGSDSPVNEELSTHMFGEHSKTLMSAGTKSPCSSFTMSPIVINAASTKLTSPPRTTVTRGGRIDLNSFIMLSDFAFCRYENTPVTVTTQNSTTPRYKLSACGSIP